MAVDVTVEQRIERGREDVARFGIDPANDTRWILALDSARLAMRSVKAPFPMTVVYEFEEAAEGATLARIHAGGEARGFYSVAGPLLNQMVRRGIRRDLEALRDLMERRWGGVRAEG
jgi:hypothetical protein